MPGENWWQFETEGSTRLILVQLVKASRLDKSRQARAAQALEW